MNINIHKANERRFAEIMDTTLNTTRTVWEIMTLSHHKDRIKIFGGAGAYAKGF